MSRGTFEAFVGRRRREIDAPIRALEDREPRGLSSLNPPCEAAIC